MTTGLAPICFACINLDGVRPPDGWVCRAFPDGIPVQILVHQHDHHEPYPGDRGIRFELRGSEQEAADMAHHIHVHLHRAGEAKDEGTSEGARKAAETKRRANRPREVVAGSQATFRRDRLRRRRRDDGCDCR
jgi:hypothetical protein